MQERDPGFPHWVMVAPSVSVWPAHAEADTFPAELNCQLRTGSGSCVLGSPGLAVAVSLLPKEQSHLLAEVALGTELPGGATASLSLCLSLQVNVCVEMAGGGGQAVGSLAVLVVEVILLTGTPVLTGWEDWMVTPVVAMAGSACADSSTQFTQGQ